MNGQLLEVLIPESWLPGMTICAIVTAGFFWASSPIHVDPMVGEGSTVSISAGPIIVVAPELGTTGLDVEVEAEMLVYPSLNKDGLPVFDTASESCTGTVMVLR
jgi:hypothetical protein